MPQHLPEVLLEKPLRYALDGYLQAADLRRPPVEHVFRARVVGSPVPDGAKLAKLLAGLMMK